VAGCPSRPRPGRRRRARRRDLLLREEAEALQRRDAETIAQHARGIPRHGALRHPAGERHERRVAREAGRRHHLGRFQPREKGGEFGARQGAGVEGARRDVAPGRTQCLLPRQGEQPGRARGLEQRILGDGRGGDDPHHLPPDRRGLAALRLLRRLGLLADGDPEAAADQAGEVGVHGVHGHAAHGHRLATVLAPVGERDVERGGGFLGVAEEQLEEVAHAEEQQRVRMRRLGGEPLRERRGRALGGRDGAGRVQDGAVHPRSLPCPAAPAKRPASPAGPSPP
jgi:hypothetical protein